MTTFNPLDLVLLSPMILALVGFYFLGKMRKPWEAPDDKLGEQ